MTDPTRVKVWVTKYALTSGVSITLIPEAKLKGAEYVVPPGYAMAFRLGVEAHLTPEGAETAVVRMKNNKIASLKKQLLEIENLNPAQIVLGAYSL